MKKTAIYAGRFDPITNGHLDLIQRAARIFDTVIVAVAVHSPKETFFSVKDRVNMVKLAVGSLKNVKVEAFEGLLIDYVHSRKANVIIRGLRAFSDFEVEFQMALVNRKLAPDIETLFMMPHETYSYINSGRVKELWSLGGKISDFVPRVVEQYMNKTKKEGHYT